MGLLAGRCKRTDANACAAFSSPCASAQRGWVKTISSEAFDTDVQVNLVQAIGRGDEVCQSRVDVGVE